MYFALNAATHEAACACWAIKRYYHAWRPLSAIRYLAQLGQSSDPSLPSYHTNGIPLVPDLIEMVTEDSVGSGRHTGLTPGKIAVLGWPGQPEFPVDQVSGVKWVHMESWIAYQLKTFVTPAFPGYTSGHSTFSRCRDRGAGRWFHPDAQRLAPGADARRVRSRRGNRRGEPAILLSLAEIRSVPR